MTKRSANNHKQYHAHIYFDSSTQRQARDLCMAAWPSCHVGLGRFHLKPVGPHPVWSCQLTFDADELDHVIPWLDEHRGGLNILVHPLTNDALAEHTSLAGWLGEAAELDVAMFEK